MKKHEVTCRNNGHHVKVFIVEDEKRNGFWWAVKGSHMANFTEGKPFRSDKKLENARISDVFTYFGNGMVSKPGNIADMETFVWLLRNKI